MSIELVEREIYRFLGSSDPEVLCLRGRWGVGKTFSWNMFLRQAKAKDGIALPTYSYVSLFGRNHLAELRYAIFENSMSKGNIGIEPSLESLKSNTNAIAEQFGRKTFGWLGSLPIGRDYIGAFQSASYLWVRQKIVCFDDIERKGLRASWRLYHDSFENNETEVVNGILSAFREHVTLVTQANLSGMVSLLKALGHAHEASDAIEFYMAQRNEDPDFFNLAEIPFAEEITDTDVRSALDRKFLSFGDSRIPLDVLLKIAERNGWSRKDLALLSRLDTEDYYTLFKSQNGPELRSIVEACLRFGATDNADAEMRAIGEKAKQALVRIGRESRINRIRVERKYKVEVGE